MAENITIANIVLRKQNVQDLTSAFKTYALSNAELIAKKELALMGLAINNAAAKGSTSVYYKASRDFTALQGEFYNKAVEIINADLQAAEYAWDVTYKAKSNYAVGFTFNWANLAPSDEEPEPTDPEPTDPVVDPEPTDEPGGNDEPTGNEDPTDEPTGNEDPDNGENLNPEDNGDGENDEPVDENPVDGE